MEFVNYQYLNNNTIQFLDTDGNIINKSVEELGYPYFWGIPDPTERFTNYELSHIVKTERRIIPYLTQEGIQYADAYKVYVTEPRFIPALRKRFTKTFEAKIPYIRRLAFDNNIKWASKVIRYADIDIEERDGGIVVIGYKDNVTHEYMPLHSVEELVQILEERKILEIYAWNGEGYDYDRISSMTNNTYFQNILKIDSMYFYSIFQQKPLKSLNQAGKEVGVGQKVKLNKPFSKLTLAEIGHYNKGDVELQEAILDKLGIRNLIHNYSSLLALHPKEIYSESRGKSGNLQLRASAVRAFDSIVIRQNETRVYLLDREGAGSKIEYEGGFVLEPKGGLYHNVAGIDYNSLYPHWIMYKDYDNYIYRLVKKYEEYYYDERLKYKKLYKETNNTEYDTTQQNLKILINSIYGVFANPYFRYFNPYVASFITEGCRGMIKAMMDLLIELGFKVVYGDTDSIFIYDVSKGQAEYAVNEINTRLAPFEVKLEKFYVRAIFFD